MSFSVILACRPIRFSVVLRLVVMSLGKKELAALFSLVCNVCVVLSSY